MPKISAVIITRNEAQLIERCLASLQDVADEVVVFDSHSTDRTPELCRKQGVRFFDCDWKGYSDTKNAAISEARHDYILSVDGDEVLSSELSASILAAKPNLEGAYRFNILTNYCGRWIHHCGWYPAPKLRLWNRQDGLWEGDIHEAVKLKPGTPVHHLAGDLHHYSYLSIAAHVQQINHYTELTAQDAYKNGKRASLPMLCLAPCARFLKMFVLKRGFLDGYYGYLISRISAQGVFLKYAKLRELYRTRKRSDA